MRRAVDIETEDGELVELDARRRAKAGQGKGLPRAVARQTSLDVVGRDQGALLVRMGNRIVVLRALQGHRRMLAERRGAVSC